MRFGNRAIYQIVVQNFQNSIFMVDFKKIPFFVVWFKKIPNLWFGLTGQTFFGAISPMGVATWPLGIFRAISPVPQAKWPRHFACGTGEMP